ncbi:hypothetical protein CPC16_012024 [Podila verticillata]|nr:hypothetical protein CPC16_012024 [Podila verticillata]
MTVTTEVTLSLKSLSAAMCLVIQEKEKTTLYVVDGVRVVISRHISEVGENRTKVIVVGDLRADQIKEVLADRRNGFRKHGKTIVGTSRQGIGYNVHRTGSVFNFVINFNDTIVETSEYC